MISASSEKENRRDIMAVESTDLQDLLKNIDLKSIIGSSTMADTTGGLGIGGGVLGAVLVGALLPRLLGDPNSAAAVAAADHHNLTAADVQNIVTNTQNSQTLGQIDGEIWKAEGQLQAALQAQSNAGQIATLNAEIANLQGQGAITTAIAESKFSTANEVHENGAAVIASGRADTASLAATMNSLAASLAAGHAEINAGVAQAKYDNTMATIVDGDKTRAAIAALGASIPNARELDLQRQLTVALDDHRHTATRGFIDSGNTTVTTNVNQATAVAQQQQQIQGIQTTLASLVPYIQNIGQSVVNLGSMTASPTTATAVRA